MRGLIADPLWIGKQAGTYLFERQLISHEIFDFVMTMGSPPNRRFGGVKERREIHPHPDPLPSRERVYSK